MEIVYRVTVRVLMDTYCPLGRNQAVGFGESYGIIPL
jgi:hypothetical protein